MKGDKILNDINTGKEKIFRVKADLGDQDLKVEKDFFKATIEFALSQLEYHKKESGKKTRGYLAEDIKGYKMILESNDPNANAKLFLDAKRERLNSDRFKNNMAVIEYLKSNKKWV